MSIGFNCMKAVSNSTCMLFWILSNMSQESHRSLLITHNFPPDSEVGGRRLALFSRYLPTHSVEPVVLTTCESTAFNVDAGMSLSPGVRLVRTAVLPNPISLYVYFKSCFFKNGTHGSPKSMTSKAPAPVWFRWIKKQLLAAFASPGDDIGWYLPAIRSARRLFKENRFNSILSSGPPWAAHLIALHLKSSFGVRWVADFRDPWTGGPEWQQLPSWRKTLESRFEALCIQNSDAVVCNTDRIRLELSKRYPHINREKFHTITNGFDDIHPMCGIGLAQPNSRLMLHLGSIYGVRENELFFQALSNLIKFQPEMIPLKVLLVGDSDPAFVERIQSKFPELLAGGFLEFQQRISWNLAQQLLWAADLLLIFQGSYTLQVPAKFYEYLPTGKPIFAIADEGALTDLIKLTESGIAVGTQNVEDIEKGFLKILDFPSLSSDESIRKWSTKFHFSSLTAKVARVLVDDLK
jgi:hypothetical protein